MPEARSTQDDQLATQPTEQAERTAEASDRRQQSDAAEALEKAERCRRLAAGISDKQTAEVLRALAANYEQSAARLSGR